MTFASTDSPDARTPVETRARLRLEDLAKPVGALGRLEDLAIRLCGAAGTLSPSTRPRTLVVFAADHGTVASGISLWPQSVSRAVTETVLVGKAGCSVLAASTGTKVRVVDVGLAEMPSEKHGKLDSARIRAGSRDMTLEPALTPDEFEAALKIGARIAADEQTKGSRLLIAGDIGIGNTTATAALTALLCDLDVDTVVGPGAGATASTLAAKRRTIAAALCRDCGDVRSAIASMCGLEIAAMAGFYLEAARLGVPVVLDGAVSGAAALIAAAFDPAASRSMIAAHLSPEPAHRIALRKLGLTPFLDWGMRLGEGTGALALLPQIDMAADLMTRMATLDEALALANV